MYLLAQISDYVSRVYSARCHFCEQNVAVKLLINAHIYSAACHISFKPISHALGHALENAIVFFPGPFTCIESFSQLWPVTIEANNVANTLFQVAFSMNFPCHRF